MIGHRQVDVGIVHQGNLARLRSYVHKLREGVPTKMGELALCRTKAHVCTYITQNYESQGKMGERTLCRTCAHVCSQLLKHTIHRARWVNLRCAGPRHMSALILPKRTIQRESAPFCT